MSICCWTALAAWVLARPTKFDYARQITAALAYIALADLDRVSVVAFAHELLATFPLTRGKQRIVLPAAVPG